MNPQISKKITERIKKENIKPTPKWHFVFKNWVFWILFGLSVVLGSLAFSIVIFEFSETETDIFTELSFSDLIIDYLPIFWFVFLAGFIALAYYGAKHTKKGYKFSPLLILTSSIAISAIFGILIFAIGGAEKAEGTLANKLKFYRGLHERREDIWRKSEKGFLGGQIISVDEENKVILLQDFNEKKWNVDYNKVPKIPEFILQQGLKIRIMGDEVKKGEFNAKMIKPWIGIKEERMIQMMNENPRPEIHEIMGEDRPPQLPPPEILEMIKRNKRE